MQPLFPIKSLYIDFDAFFANVEKQVEPSIRMRPVGITALDSDYSALITVYVEFNQRIVQQINQHVPVKKIWSIDEMECELIGREQSRAQDIAIAIQDSLRLNIGAFVTPSIGLAPNQFLAKIAAEMDKPNGFVILRAQDLPTPLFRLKLKDLPGISDNIEARLNKANVKSVKDLWHISPKHARAIWGNVDGERLWAQLHGHYTETPPTKRRMFGHSRVLSGAFKEPDKALECLRLLTVKAAHRLRRENYTTAALSISVKVQTRGQSKGFRWSANTQFSPCRDDRSILAHMHKLYEKGIREARPWRLRHVSVMLHDIATSSERGRDLFEDPAQRNWEHLSDVMDAFNRKHGGALIHLGTRPKIPGGYAGAKIAFGRIPDKEDFF